MKALKILLDERKQQLDIFERNKELGNPNESNYIVLLNEAIKELEELENKDRLAELEKVILDYYLAKGYKVDLFGSKFQVNISTFQNQKEIQIMFKKDFNSNYETVFRVTQETTKEMFDAAFEYFSIKEQQMKAIAILNLIKNNDIKISGILKEDIFKAIKELEDLQNENKSLVKTLEKYNEEMIELRKCNQDLLNTVIEAQKVIKNVLEGRK